MIKQINNAKELDMIANTFFTQEDFELFDLYAGKSKNEFPKAHNLLKNVYNKLGKITDALNKTGKYKCEIRRNPLNQGKVYERYHWAKVYPCDLYDVCSPGIFFVIGLTAKGLNIHIDSYTPKRYIPNETAEKIKNKTWKNYVVEDVIKRSFESIILEIENYINEYLNDFLLFGQEFGIDECIKRLKKINMEHKKLLESCKNLILAGAPGTGKTYLAKQIAKQIIGVTTDEDLEKSEQFAFVQFHPSYDYTDFVEGLRPTKPDDNGNIGFELKDGVFKEFCKKAREKGSMTRLDDAIEKFKEECSDKMVKVKNKSGYEFSVTYRDGITFRVRSDKSEAEDGKDFPANIESVKRLYQGIEEGIYNKTYVWGILEYLKNKYNVSEYQEDKSDKKYVFVIDEINRGEISKIFGELFFSIDPSYRGEKGAVATQYSNIHETNERFYVPENVYIIGTMNDIDRSVESFDFAMRRRFTWKEITAEESQTMFEGEIWKDEAIKRMNNLNNAIWNEKEKEKKGIEGLNSSYHIGAAYFKNNLPKYADSEKWKKLWEHHLCPLLFEYLRGTLNATENLEKLEHAYNAK